MTGKQMPGAGLSLFFSTIIGFVVTFNDLFTTFTEVGYAVTKKLLQKGYLFYCLKIKAA